MWLFQVFGKGGSSVSRCDLKQNLLDGGCSAAALEFPSSTLTITKDTPLSNKAAGTADDVTQVRPQKIHMTLRPGMSTLKTNYNKLLNFAPSAVGCRVFFFCSA